MGLFELVLGERPDALPLISEPPPDAVWRRVRPRESRPVSAKLATRNGSLRSSRGALHYRAGEHYIVQPGGRESSVVSRAVFARTYQQQPDGAYQKRNDVEYRYFVLPHTAIIATPEGRQRAAAGDWIMQGVEGELWPIDAHSAAKSYVPVANATNGSVGKDAHARPSPRPHSFSYLVESIDALAQNNDLGGDRDVSVGDIMSEVSRRSYGPLLLLVGLFAISPATIVPGMTWVAAALTLLLSLQLALGARHPWLPRQLLDVRMSREAVQRGNESMRPWARRIDGLLQPRLTMLSEPPFANIVGLLCAIAALVTFPLGLIPIAPLAPGIAIVLMGLGLFARDGLLLLIGSAVIGGAIWLAYASIT